MPVWLDGDTLSERRAADRYLAAQMAVARVLSDSVSLAEATTRVIKALCSSMAWDAGAVWEVDGTGMALVCRDIWCAPNTGLRRFVALRQNSSIPVGTGLPGLVWASGQPAWIADIGEHRAGIYNALAAKAGLHCHFGIPIRLGRNVFGVMEFFSRRTRQPDYVLLQMMAITGSLIGQFIKHRHGEKSLNESREKYELLFSGVSDAIVIYDPTTGRIEDANEAALRFYGYSREDFLKRCLSDISAENGPANIAPREFGLGDLKRMSICQQRKKDGTTFPAEVTASTFKWKDRLMGIRVERDITERKKDEEAEKLRHSEKMQREFVATVSHEFRTPVAAIQGFAETLQNGGLEDTRNRLGFVKIIKKHAGRLSRLLEDILELSTLESGKRPLNPESVALSKFIRRFSRSLGPLLKRKDLTIRVNLSSALSAYVDKTHLSQVLQNLFSNAIKFSRTGGRIHVTGRQFEHTVLVSVRDGGVGIPEEDLPKIFERFNHSQKPKGSGTGLGLSIVKQIVETHGGRIWAESAQGHGATFHFTLPTDK